MFAPVFIAFGLSVVLTPLAARLGRSVGLVDVPSGDELKIHAKPIPLGGGLGVAAATMAATAVAEPGLEMTAAVGAALLLALGVGVADDALSLPPWVRVVAQATCGLLLVWGGFRISPLGGLGAVGVVAIVLATTNAVNIMDGQDGLAGGLGAIAAAGIAGTGLGGGWATGLGGALCGALAGFLVWNRPPARVFLGDGGAYLVGVALAVLAAALAMSQGWKGVLVAATALLVFAVEIGFTVLRRVRSRARLASGDRGHSYDLVAARFGRGLALLVFWVAGAVCALAAVLLARTGYVASAWVVAALLALLAGSTAYLWLTSRGAVDERLVDLADDAAEPTTSSGNERKKGTAEG
jgi:UDP-GlcNAc:undecaprenyl-phosphate GlcNAc-1-phosphate transferase